MMMIMMMMIDDDDDETLSFDRVALLMIIFEKSPYKFFVLKSFCQIK